MQYEMQIKAIILFTEKHGVEFTIANMPKATCIDIYNSLDVE